MNTETTLKRSTILEKVFFCMGGVSGGSFCWGFISGFLIMYYTNSVGMAAAAVGTMMLIARLLDGVTDVIFGVIMERFPSKKLGKTRHWILLSAILMPVCTYLCFNMPAGLSESGKMVYMYVTYILVSAVAYTIYGTAFGAMMARMSEDKKDIEHISIVYMFCTIISATVIYILTTNLLEGWGGSIQNQPAWTKISTIYAIIVFIGIFLTFFVKEKVALKIGDDQTVERTPLREGLKIVFKYKYFWLITLFFTFWYIAAGLMGSSGIYYIGYVIGDYSIVQYTSLPSLIAQIIGFLLVPVFLKKINKTKLMLIGLIVAAASKLIILVAPTYVPLYVVMGIIGALALCPMYSLMMTMSVDFIMFLAYKTGLRTEGFAGLGGTVGIKVGTGIGTAMLGWILSMGKFDGLSLVQPDSAVTAIIFTTIIIPAIFMIAQVIVLCFWDMDKKLAEVMPKETAEAAEAETPGNAE